MKVSVLIAHYHEDAQPFLTACLKALEKQTFKDFETIVVSSNHHPRLTGIVDKQHHSPDRLHFPAAITKAYEMSDPSSTHILLLNDDCMMSKDTLKTMIETMEGFPKEIILNPRSNCSPCSGFYYSLNGAIVNGEFLPAPVQLRGDTWTDFIDKFIESPLSYPYAMVQVPFAAFFCTLVRRSTYEKVGRIDPRFRTGSDDHEFAHRANKIGIRAYTALHAAVIHASGVSADVGLTVDDRNFNHHLIKELL